MAMKIAAASTFNKRVMAEASTLISEKRFSELTDSHLAQVVNYDEAGAERAYALREAARTKAAAPVPAATIPAGIVTWKELKPLVLDMAEDVRDVVKKPLEKQIEALTKRLETLEQRPRGLQYCGVWRSEDAYVAGDVVSDKGAMWVCGSGTRARPGESNDWTLAVKAGRDGKDAR